MNDQTVAYLLLFTKSMLLKFETGPVMKAR